ncbi:unnamed protein product, partial [Meganyctiphanes norvegica]
MNYPKKVISKKPYCQNDVPTRSNIQTLSRTIFKMVPLETIIFYDTHYSLFCKFCVAIPYSIYQKVNLFTYLQGNMMDFILAVENPLEWHHQNLQLNSSHYSSLRFGGPEFITKMQDNWGAKIYFNTLVPTNEGMIKYGVISRSNLITDLMDWDTLYIAGRLHKPVMILDKDRDDDELISALKINLYQAIHSALLMLPESFSEDQLYNVLAGLSYSGENKYLMGRGLDIWKNRTSLYKHDLK